VSLSEHSRLQAMHYAVQVPELGTETKAASVMVRFLLAQPQVDIKATTADGNNTLHYLGACLTDRAQHAQLLPLSVPSEMELWQLLLRHGVDDQLRNDNGHTAIGKLWKNQFSTWTRLCRKANVNWANPPSDIILLQIVFQCLPNEARDMHDEMTEQHVGDWPMKLFAFHEFCRNQMQSPSAEMDMDSEDELDRRGPRD